MNLKEGSGLKSVEVRKQIHPGDGPREKGPRRTFRVYSGGDSPEECGPSRRARDGGPAPEGSQSCVR